MTLQEERDRHLKKYKTLNFSYCPVCKKSYVSEKYCYTCGGLLIQKIYNLSICECGQELYNGDNYCRWCGVKT